MMRIILLFLGLTTVVFGQEYQYAQDESNNREPQQLFDPENYKYKPPSAIQQSYPHRDPAPSSESVEVSRQRLEPKPRHPPRQRSRQRLYENPPQQNQDLSGSQPRGPPRNVVYQKPYEDQPRTPQRYEVRSRSQTTSAQQQQQQRALSRHRSRERARQEQAQQMETYNHGLPAATVSGGRDQSLDDIYAQYQQRVEEFERIEREKKKEADQRRRTRPSRVQSEQRLPAARVSTPRAAPQPQSVPEPVSYQPQPESRVASVSQPRRPYIQPQQISDAQQRNPQLRPQDNSVPRSNRRPAQPSQPLEASRYNQRSENQRQTYSQSRNPVNTQQYRQAPESRPQPQTDSEFASLTVASLPRDTDGDGIPGEAGKDYPTLNSIPSTSFSCGQQPLNGYYADLETACQVVHLCQAGGVQDSYICPNGTVFNQQVFSCQWWYKVDCPKSAHFYQLNDNLYKVPEPVKKAPPPPSPSQTRQTEESSPDYEYY
ncbi:uncharacterized protein LOC143237212 [Tachypleus tridentatus]|uniref:uncharacterized protein LOC143237212 n=1 Tax=Tachypleus tridentatus TaxID=6853 RepID=UPI003FD143F7